MSMQYSLLLLFVAECAENRCVKEIWGEKDGESWEKAGVLFCIYKCIWKEGEKLLYIFSSPIKIRFPFDLTFSLRVNEEGPNYISIYKKASMTLFVVAYH
jgi:hypothetical protein